MTALIPRNDRNLIAEALGDTRCVFLLGARQVGKSTLARQMADDHLTQSISLDDKGPRDAALTDPEGFVAGLSRPVLIDEVQRGGPDLLLSIKKVVDRDLRPGQFLLTGSANVLRHERTIDALTGRAEIIRLWPLAQAEIERTSTNFVDAAFSGKPPNVEAAPVGRDALRVRIAAGGYPEARKRTEQRRKRWFESYLSSTFEQDLQSIADLEKPHEVPRLMRLLAAQTANLFNPTAIGSKLGLELRTVQRYVDLLETIFLVKRIRAWRPGLGQREVQRAKAYIADSGLLLHLLGSNDERLLGDDQITGKALESFVAMEVLRHAEWSERMPGVFHYRRGKSEIDLILEDRSGQIVAVEVKASATIRARDWRSLENLRDQYGAHFRCGIVIHTGEQTVPLGDRLFAVPLSGLWTD